MRQSSRKSRGAKAGCWRRRTSRRRCCERRASRYPATHRAAASRAPSSAGTLPPLAPLQPPPPSPAATMGRRGSRHCCRAWRCANCARARPWWCLARAPSPTGGTALQLVESAACRLTRAPIPPAWWLPRRRALLRTPERRLSSWEAWLQELVSAGAQDEDPPLASSRHVQPGRLERRLHSLHQGKARRAEQAGQRHLASAAATVRRGAAQDRRAARPARGAKVPAFEVP